MKVRTKGEILQELERCQKLLAQALERDAHPRVTMNMHDAIDAAVGKAHEEYRRLAGKLYWKQDYSL